MRKHKKIGLVLGAGAAKGWAHIGVLRELELFGLKPDIICGTSMGALIGASYATGHLESLENIANSLTRTRVLRYFDIIIGVSLSGDFISRPNRIAKSELTEMDQNTAQSKWLKWLSNGLPFGLSNDVTPDPEVVGNGDRDRPSYLDVLSEVFFITTNFVARVRLAADPLDLLIVPKVEDIGLMDFHRAKKTIDAGHQSVIAQQDKFQKICDSISNL